MDLQDTERVSRNQVGAAGADEGSMSQKKVTGIVTSLQMELFEIEETLSQFEQKRKEVRARLAALGAGTKTCTKCAEEMDLEQFYRDRQKFDKRSSWCCECVRAAVLDRYHAGVRERNIVSRGSAA
jgi:hypothetical protein